MGKDQQSLPTSPSPFSRSTYTLKNSICITYYQSIRDSDQPKASLGILTSLSLTNKRKADTTTNRKGKGKGNENYKKPNALVHCSAGQHPTKPYKTECGQESFHIPCMFIWCCKESNQRVEVTFIALGLLRIHKFKLRKEEIEPILARVLKSPLRHFRKKAETTKRKMV